MNNEYLCHSDWLVFIAIAILIFPPEAGRHFHSERSEATGFAIAALIL